MDTACGPANWGLWASPVYLAEGRLQTRLVLISHLGLRHARISNIELSYGGLHTNSDDVAVFLVEILDVEVLLSLLNYPN